MSATPFRATRVILAFLVALVACVPPALSADEPDAEERRYIVVLEDSVDHPEAVAATQTERYGGKLGFVYRYALKGYSVGLSEAAVVALAREPNVKSVEVDDLRAPAAQTTPTGVKRVFPSGASDIDEVDDVKVNADVAVIDSGVDNKHSDLNVFKRTDCSNGTEKGAECINESGTPNEHGTHVAGTVGALDDGNGVVGIAPGVRIWGVKVLETGANYESEEIAGIDWVTSKSADIEVANMSIQCKSGLPCEEGAGGAWKAAISKSVAEGIVYVVAAGNSAGDAKTSVFGTHPDVMTVSAIADYNGEPGGGSKPVGCTEKGEDDKFATFSNYGKDIEIAAPGVCIYSTIPSVKEGEKDVPKYGFASGTSMAAPLVSGAAAILASESNPETKEDVYTIGETLMEWGNYNWEDTSPDGVQEPLLDIGSLTGHALWRINGVSLTAGSETMTGEQEGSGILEVPGIGMGIECEKWKLIGGKIEALGHGSGTLALSECWVLLAPKLGAAKTSKATCDVKNMESSVLLLLQRHGGPLVIVKPAAGETLLTLKIIGEKCVLAESIAVKGSFAARIGPEAVKLPLEAVKATKLKEKLGVGLFFSAQKADLHAKGFLTLSGKETGKKMGAL